MRRVGVERRRRGLAIARPLARNAVFVVLSRGWMRRGLLRRLLLCPPLLCLPLMTGCLYHTRKLQPVKVSGVVITADAAQLAGSVNATYNSIQSLSATVDLQASVGGAQKGTVTDYTSFRGFILIRKPEMLRVIGLLPVVRTQAFDLVSDGSTFKLFVPSQSKVIEGKNSLTSKSPNPLMNLRPNVFFDSMLIRAIGPEDQVILTTDNNISQDPKTKKWTEERDYKLEIVQEKSVLKGSGPFRELIDKRVIHFNRDNLQPIEQDVYDRDGNLETVTLFGPLQTFGTERFPGTITIKRPQDEYQIVMTIQKLVLNQTLKDDQFQLEIPEGVKIQKVD
jgi:outer membrane lipoprotein-sorting protein